MAFLGSHQEQVTESCLKGYDGTQNAARGRMRVGEGRPPVTFQLGDVEEAKAGAAGVHVAPSLALEEAARKGRSGLRGVRGGCMAVSLTSGGLLA